MEDLKAYMESGVLELYVMGDLPLNERQGVEDMAVKYPEVKKELEEIERAIEKYATSYAVEPASVLRAKIVNELNTGVLPDTQPVPKVISLSSRNSFYKYAFAACIALLLVSWSALLVVYQQLQDSRTEIVALQGAKQQFAANANYFQEQLSDQKTINRVLGNPDFKFVNLAGTPLAPKANMKVAFNPKSAEVMIDLEALNMPVNDKVHQYQLWALVDGKPVDLGVFDKSADSTGMLKMKAISHLQTFAVTLEPRGGSVNPTLTRLMVAGNI